jgi:hypothetical protein
MRLIKKPDEAKRLARTILSDILLYNQAKVKEGIEQDSLFDILTEELAEGKKYYESMVDEEIRKDSNLFNEAIVDVLINKILVHRRSCPCRMLMSRKYAISRSCLTEQLVKPRLPMRFCSLPGPLTSWGVWTRGTPCSCTSRRRLPGR